MLQNYAIKVNGLSKVYKISHLPHESSLKQTLHRKLITAWHALLNKENSELSPRAIEEDFWALRDVSFEIKPGEIIGIVGHNGSGKTTLLKILSRITNPTHGSASVYGRLASLLGVGTGLHPELSGRENIYLGGALLGMSEKEINKKFQEIVTFSGVEEFLEMPVKYYSSGMGVRLAFSIAVHLDSEILFLDEIWAVGDQDFQQKSLEKMQSLITSGRTIIMVSHSADLVRQYCTRALLLEKGKLLADGSPEDVLKIYEASSVK